MIHKFATRALGSVVIALFLLLVSIFLTGCVTNPVRNDVPVAVSCVTAMPTRPDYRTPKLPPDATDSAKVVAVALDWMDSRPYEAKLEAGLEACK